MHSYAQSGTTLAIAVAAIGTAFAARQTNYDGEELFAFRDLVVERFE